MKTPLSLAIALSLIFIAACHSKPKDAKKDVQFYPANSFINAEIKKLDTIPLAVLKKTTVNGKTDSAFISKEEFKQAMRVFLEPDITDPRIKDLYTETVFMDATLNAITLTYSPGENKAEVRKLDVLLDPENNRLERIYMEKEKKNGLYFLVIKQKKKFLNIMQRNDQKYRASKKHYFLIIGMKN